VDRKKLEQLYNRYRDQNEPDKIGKYPPGLSFLDVEYLDKLTNILARTDSLVPICRIAGLRIRIRILIGSVLNRASGSGSVFEIGIRIQEGKIIHKSRKN
jgi:hypothetical protein